MLPRQAPARANWLLDNGVRPPHTSRAITHEPTFINIRRGGFSLNLDLSSLTPRRDERSAEEMLVYKIIEDPDFSLMARWKPGHAAWSGGYVREDIDLPEGTDFFAQKFFAEKLRFEAAKNGALPPPPRFRFMQQSALRDFDKMAKAENEEAHTGERDRLLRCKIEHNIPDVATTEKEEKALRKIKLQTLEDAGILSFSNDAIKTLLKIEMDGILANGDDADFDGKLISDIVSVYSGDIDEEYWNLPSTMEVLMNNKHQEAIEKWIPSPSATMHQDLGHGHELEETEETFDEIYEEFLRKEENLGEGEMMFSNLHKLGQPGFDAEDDEIPEREPGFYSNILSDMSSFTSSSASDEDETDDIEEDENSDVKHDTPPSSTTKANSEDGQTTDEDLLCVDTSCGAFEENGHEHKSGPRRDSGYKG